MSSPLPSVSPTPTSSPATNSTTPLPRTNSTASPPPPPLTNSTTSPPAGDLTSPPPPVAAASLPNGSTPAAVLPQPPKGLPPAALAGLIVGIAVGAIIVLIGVGIFVCLYRRKKRKTMASSPPPEHKDDLHAGPIHYGQQSARPTPENKLTLLPMPPSPGTGPNPPKSPVFGPSHPEPPSISISLDSKKPFQPPSPGIAFGFSQNTFTNEELAKATDGFSNANLLGQGGFGYVHKGVLPNGKVVAVKQLKTDSKQGEREFRAEIEIISRVHHRHLVSLVGCSITGAQRMLVYEFVPNNTLEFHLHGKGRPTMDWSTRMKIAVGSAKGLAYLHEDCHPKIIHRDIKAANILLDYSFEAKKSDLEKKNISFDKVADFGLAKYSLDTDTHVSTRVMGTFGYMAPEYASTGKLTDRSDVFSFGVVLLELITGHRPVDRTQSFLDESLVDRARPLLTQALEDGNYAALVDPKLVDYDSDEMTRMISCAAACVRHSARLRPSMSQIVRALEGNVPLDDLGNGVPPGYSTVYSSYASSDYDSTQYKEDLKKFKKVALESQEVGSSEYSAPTSDYGQHQSSSSTEGQQTTQEMENQSVEKNIRDSH